MKNFFSFPKYFSIAFLAIYYPVAFLQSFHLVRYPVKIRPVVRQNWALFFAEPLVSDFRVQSYYC